MDINIKIIAEEENAIDLSKSTYTNAELLDILNKVGKGVAKHAMDCIVANVEHGVPSERAWWSIRDAYDIEVKDQMQMLPSNRATPDEIKDRFYQACMNGDIHELKECFELGARINCGDRDYLSLTCSFGSPKTIEFFLLNKETKYQAVNLQHNAVDCFKSAYEYGNIPILQYLISVHKIHKNEEIKKLMTEDWFINNPYLENVESIIKSSELNEQLQNNLSLKPNIVKLKI